MGSLYGGDLKIQNEILLKGNSTMEIVKTTGGLEFNFKSEAEL